MKSPEATSAGKVIPKEGYDGAHLKKLTKKEKAERDELERQIREVEAQLRLAKQESERVQLEKIHKELTDKNKPRIEELHNRISDANGNFEERRENEIRKQKNEYFANVEKNKDLNQYTDELKKKKMGALVNELSSVPGFNELSNGQKMLVMQGMGDKLLSQVKEDGLKKFQEEIAKTKNKSWKEFFTAKGFGKSMTGLYKNIRKPYFTAKYTKESLNELRSDSSETAEKRKDFLNNNVGELVKVYSEAGVDAYLGGKDGKTLITDYAGLENASPEVAKIANAFNEAASARMPYEWSLKDASRKQRKAYEKWEKNYSLAKAAYGEALKRHLEENKSMEKFEGVTPEMFAAERLSESEIMINTMKFLTTHPNATAELRKIGSRSAFRQGMGGVIAERGLIMGLGYESRRLLSGVCIAAGPALGGIFGYIRGKERAKKTLKEHDKLARGGVLQKGKTSVGMGNIERRMSRLNEIREELMNETDPIKRFKLMNDLKTHTEFINAKLEMGQLNFGKSDGRFSRQYDLMRALHEAQVAIQVTANDKAIKDAFGYDIANSNIKGRLGSLVEKIGAKRQAELEKNRQAYKEKQALKSAAIGVAAGSLGAWLRNYGESVGWFHHAPKTWGIEALDKQVESLVSGAKFIGDEIYNSILNGTHTVEDLMVSPAATVASIIAKMGHHHGEETLNAFRTLPGNEHSVISGTNNSAEEMYKQFRLPDDKYSGHSQLHEHLHGSGHGHTVHHEEVARPATQEEINDMENGNDQININHVDKIESVTPAPIKEMPVTVTPDEFQPHEMPLPKFYDDYDFSKHDLHWIHRHARKMYEDELDKYFDMDNKTDIHAMESALGTKASTFVKIEPHGLPQYRQFYRDIIAMQKELDMQPDGMGDRQAELDYLAHSADLNQDPSDLPGSTKEYIQKLFEEKAKKMRFEHIQLRHLRHLKDVEPDQPSLENQITHADHPLGPEEYRPQETITPVEPAPLKTMPTNLDHHEANPNIEPIETAPVKPLPTEINPQHVNEIDLNLDQKISNSNIHETVNSHNVREALHGYSKKDGGLTPRHFLREYRHNHKFRYAEGTGKTPEEADKNAYDQLMAENKNHPFGHGHQETFVKQLDNGDYQVMMIETARNVKTITQENATFITDYHYSPEELQSIQTNSFQNLDHDIAEVIGRRHYEVWDKVKKMNIGEFLATNSRDLSRKERLLQRFLKEQADLYNAFETVDSKNYQVPTISQDMSVNDYMFGIEVIKERILKLNEHL